MNNIDFFRFLLQRDVNTETFKLLDDVEDLSYQSDKVLEQSELNLLSPAQSIACHDFEEPSGQFWVPDRVWDI